MFQHPYSIALLVVLGFVSRPLVSLLMVKVSGVAMLEKTISDRRPQYADCFHRTNAFFPGPSRTLNILKEVRK